MNKIFIQISKTLHINCSSLSSSTVIVFISKHKLIQVHIGVSDEPFKLQSFLIFALHLEYFSQILHTYVKNLPSLHISVPSRLNYENKLVILFLNIQNYWTLFLKGAEYCLSSDTYANHQRGEAKSA